MTWLLGGGRGWHVAIAVGFVDTQLTTIDTVQLFSPKNTKITLYCCSIYILWFSHSAVARQARAVYNYSVCNVQIVL